MAKPVSFPAATMAMAKPPSPTMQKLSRQPTVNTFCNIVAHPNANICRRPFSDQDWKRQVNVSITLLVCNPLTRLFEAVLQVGNLSMFCLRDARVCSSRFRFPTLPSVRIRPPNMKRSTSVVVASYQPKAKKPLPRKISSGATSSDPLPGADTVAADHAQPHATKVEAADSTQQLPCTHPDADSPPEERMVDCQQCGRKFKEADCFCDNWPWKWRCKVCWKVLDRLRRLTFASSTVRLLCALLDSTVLVGHLWIFSVSFRAACASGALQFTTNVSSCFAWAQNFEFVKLFRLGTEF